MWLLSTGSVASKTSQFLNFNNFMFNSLMWLVGTGQHNFRTWPLVVIVLERGSGAWPLTGTCAGAKWSDAHQ